LKKISDKKEIREKTLLTAAVADGGEHTQVIQSNSRHPFATK
jgi:hypothetical protein